MTWSGRATDSRFALCSARMTPFQQRLNQILSFGLTQILLAVVKNPATQASVAGYAGLAIGLVSLVEAFLPSHPMIANPATIANAAVPPAA